MKYNIRIDNDHIVDYDEPSRGGQIVKWWMNNVSTTIYKNKAKAIILDDNAYDYKKYRLGEHGEFLNNILVQTSYKKGLTWQKTREAINKLNNQGNLLYWEGDKNV